MINEVSTVARPGAEGDPDSHLAGLVARMAGGDEKALACFYDLTHGKAYAVAMRILRHTETAEDALEDAYWQAWREAPRYDPARGRALAWLLTICRSRALDTLRRRDPAESVADVETLADELADANADPCGLLSALQRDGAIARAIEGLKPQARQLVAFAFFRGMTHEEIAETCKLPLGTVKTTLTRAYQQLKRSLAGHGWEPDYE
ncbi:MAG TPA: sigma-70 family RNA polymerase sigma factor [Burkholderiaceae bacterium]|nr:sigma-70 family RNA polymerase sigma factor [Burkholderiaceae bacterium]